MGLSDEALLERLNEHPGLRSRVELMLLAVVDEKGELQEVDAAEMQLIEQMRHGSRVVTSMGDRASRQGRRKGWARERGMARG